jgi:general L-amino acid transport system ATP-binding protein
MLTTNARGISVMPELSHAPAHKLLSDQVMIRMGGVYKWYGAFHVLKTYQPDRQQEQVYCHLCHSGSGKSTMIRCVDRLEEY